MHKKHRMNQLGINELADMVREMAHSTYKYSKIKSH